MQESETRKKKTPLPGLTAKDMPMTLAEQAAYARENRMNKSARKNLRKEEKKLAKQSRKKFMDKRVEMLNTGGPGIKALTTEQRNEAIQTLGIKPKSRTFKKFMKTERKMFFKERKQLSRSGGGREGVALLPEEMQQKIQDYGLGKRAAKKLRGFEKKTFLRNRAQAGVDARRVASDLNSALEDYKQAKGDPKALAEKQKAIEQLQEKVKKTMPKPLSKDELKARKEQLNLSRSDRRELKRYDKQIKNANIQSFMAERKFAQAQGKTDYIRKKKPTEDFKSRKEKAKELGMDKETKKEFRDIERSMKQKGIEKNKEMIEDRKAGRKQAKAETKLGEVKAKEVKTEAKQAKKKAVKAAPKKADAKAPAAREPFKQRTDLGNARRPETTSTPVSIDDAAAARNAQPGWNAETKSESDPNGLLRTAAPGAMRNELDAMQKDQKIASGLEQQFKDAGASPPATPPTVAPQTTPQA